MSHREALKRALEIWWEKKELWFRGIIILLCLQIPRALFGYFSPDIMNRLEVTFSSGAVPSQQGEAADYLLLFSHFLAFILVAVIASALLVLVISGQYSRICRLVIGVETETGGGGVAGRQGATEARGAETPEVRKEEAGPGAQAREARVAESPWSDTRGREGLPGRRRNPYLALFLLLMPVLLIESFSAALSASSLRILAAPSSVAIFSALFQGLLSLASFVVSNLAYVVVAFAVPLFLLEPARTMGAISGSLRMMGKKAGLVVVAWLISLLLGVVVNIILGLVLSPLSIGTLLLRFRYGGDLGQAILSLYNLLISVPQGIFWSFLMVYWLLVFLFVSGQVAKPFGVGYLPKPRRVGLPGRIIKRLALGCVGLLVVELILGVTSVGAWSYVQNQREVALRSELLSEEEIEAPRELPPTVKAEDVEREDLYYYLVQVSINSSSMSLRGKETIEYTNFENVPLDKLYIHVYPRAYDSYSTAPVLVPPAETEGAGGSSDFIPGQTAIEVVKVDGAEVDYNLTKTILEVDLGRTLDPGEKAEIYLEFSQTLPKNRDRFGYYENLISLGNWLPLLAVYDDEGWHLDDFVPMGDPFYSDYARFRVEIEVDKDQVVSATGLLVDKKELEKKDVLIFEAAPVRDFAIMLSKNYAVLNTSSNGIDIYSYFLKDNLVSGNNVLIWGQKAVDFFNQTFGAYPYRTYYVTQSLNQYGGMEYPQLIQVAYLDTLIPFPMNLIMPDPVSRLDEYITVHETAHQWWYGVVGNDQVNQPWLDEALAEYSTYLYFRHYYGQKRADEIYTTFNHRPGTGPIEKGIMDKTIFDYQDMEQYNKEIYVQGSEILIQLEKLVGWETMSRILKTYYSQFRYKNATVDDFVAVAEEVSGRDLTAFFAPYRMEREIPERQTLDKQIGRHFWEDETWLRRWRDHWAWQGSGRNIPVLGMRTLLYLPGVWLGQPEIVVGLAYLTLLERGKSVAEDFLPRLTFNLSPAR